MRTSSASFLFLLVLVKMMTATFHMMLALGILKMKPSGTDCKPKLGLEMQFWIRSQKKAISSMRLIFQRFDLNWILFPPRKITLSLNPTNKFSSTVFLAIFLQEKHEWWWIYVTDRRRRELITRPQMICNLKDEEKVSVWSLTLHTHSCTNKWQNPSFRSLGVRNCWMVVRNT